MKCQHPLDKPGVFMRKEKSIVLQDSFLQQLQDDRTQVHIFLISGIKLVGKIVNFDQYSIELNNGTSQVVFKRAISTVQAS